MNKILKNQDKNLKQSFLKRIVTSAALATVSISYSSFAFLTQQQVTDITDGFVAGILILVGLATSIMIAVTLPKIGVKLSKKFTEMMAN